MNDRMINISTNINAPIDRCFDLARCIDLHMDSTSQTKEKAVDGVTSGLIGLDEEVVWQASHFGIRQKLRVKISVYDRPNHFQDKQIHGIFKSFTHDHHFSVAEQGTLMTDRFYFECPFGALGAIAAPFVFRHLKSFLVARNKVIKAVAEGSRWQKYL